MRLFLHLGQEAKPRYQLIAFNFMVLVVLVVVFGSIWIMQNLDYHHDDTMKSSDTYIIKDEGIETQRH
jgi:heme/copper-type cytochrome/quinol oxidase subunit 4